MDRARLSARTAGDVLVAELDLTPKPGLVDREHRGAHRDMDYERMRAGAEALRPALHSIAACAQGASRASVALREEIGELGRKGEREMLRATGGVNTHRGALWALGLLVAGEGLRGPRDARSIAARAGGLARLNDRFCRPPASNGLAALARYGAAGARGEAQRAFPSAVGIALPLLRRGASATHVLHALIATVDDTCLLHRGGARGLNFAKAGARRVLESACDDAAVHRFGRAMSEARLSPGGSADTLAAALFLNAIARP